MGSSCYLRGVHTPALEINGRCSVGWNPQLKALPQLSVDRGPCDRVLLHCAAHFLPSFPIILLMTAWNLGFPMCFIAAAGPPVCMSIAMAATSGSCINGAICEWNSNGEVGLRVTVSGRNWIQ